MKRVVKSSLALSLVFVMVLTSGLVVNASDLQPIEKTEAEDGKGGSSINRDDTTNNSQVHIQNTGIICYIISVNVVRN